MTCLSSAAEINPLPEGNTYMYVHLLMKIQIWF